MTGHMKIVRFADRGNPMELMVPGLGDLGAALKKADPIDFAIRYIEAKYGDHIEREIAKAMESRIEEEGDDCGCGVYSECVPGEGCFRAD